MKTYVINFYEKLIGKCDDFAKSCTQDEIVITLLFMIIAIGGGMFAIYALDI